MVIGICRLCTQEKKLLSSHIIPKSYFKFLKGGASQLAVINENSTKIVMSNADVRENLFCKDCEKFLDNNYEKYGTRILKNRSRITRKPDNTLEITYEFKKLYLYFLSILWRVSISETYKDINLDLIEEPLRKCIYHNTLAFKDKLNIDDLIQVQLIKLYDKTGNASQYKLRKVFFDFKVTKDDDGLTFYWVIDGFRISYYVGLGDEGTISTLSKEGKTTIVERDVSFYSFFIDGINLMCDLRDRSLK